MLYASYGPVTEIDLATGTATVLAEISLGMQATAISSDGRIRYGVSEGGRIIALDLVTRVARTATLPGCGGWGAEPAIPCAGNR